MANNLYYGEEPKDFWVWVNPTHWHVRHQIQVVGCFISAGLIEPKTTNIPFIPNPNFNGDVSPFTVGVTIQYRAEFNFEIHREHAFSDYPSRLNAVYLLLSEEEAMEYQKRHPQHVEGRILKKVRTNGRYGYSVHDSSWVDFLRQPLSFDDQTVQAVTHSYWQGVKVEQVELTSMGKPWTQSPIIEALFLGRIDFYDRSLPD
ncbi:MAG: hypothetical protein ACAH17_00725 [Candidatus Paceibacterota bacterium]